MIVSLLPSTHIKRMRQRINTGRQIYFVFIWFLIMTRPSSEIPFEVVFPATPVDHPISNNQQCAKTHEKSPAEMTDFSTRKL